MHVSVFLSFFANMKKEIAIYIFFILQAIGGMAQKYPQKFFSPPVDLPLVVTGTFGEIRENHFHTGIDFSTGNEEEGIPIMAAADGYISRIKIAPDGYGKALYITHPNGYVTVYGHLQKFNSALNEYTYTIQKRTQQYEMDVIPDVNAFPVKRGEVIAYSGTTGSSTGVHLHFEIRDALTEEPINPLLFGFDVRDSVPPFFESIRIYPVRANGILEEADSARNYEVTYSRGKYSLNTETVPIVYGTIAFGFSAQDYQEIEEDSGQANLGIYSAELFVDGHSIYSWKMDRLNFETNRDVNAHIDFLSKIRDANRYEQLFFKPGNRLKIYGNPDQTGYSIFSDGATHAIKIVIKDFNGNKAEAAFTVRTDLTLRELAYLPKPDYALDLTRAKGLVFRRPKFEVFIPEGAVYSDGFFTYNEVSNSDYASDMMQIGDVYEPIQSSITVNIKPNRNLSDSIKAKAIIQLTNYYGETSSCGGEWNGEFLSAQCRSFGNFAIAIDTIPPVLEKYYIPSDMENLYGGSIKYVVKDNMTGIKSYSGKIDGVWYLFDYEKKNDMLTANVDPFMGNSDHSVEITVTDGKGNTTVWKSTFYY